MRVCPDDKGCGVDERAEPLRPCELADADVNEPLQNSGPPTTVTSMAAGSLHLDDYKRYGRQMILDGIGLPGALSRIYLTFLMGLR
jgi:hypothetical protein